MRGGIFIPSQFFFTDFEDNGLEKIILDSMNKTGAIPELVKGAGEAIA